MNASHKLPGWWTGEDEPCDAATAAAYDEMTRGDPRYRMVTITHSDELVPQGRDVVLVTDADIARGQEHVARLVGVRPDIVIVDEAHIDGGRAWAGYGRGLLQVVGRTSWIEDCILNLDRIARIRDEDGDTLKEREWAHKARLKEHAKGPRKGRRR